jgi:hypothetical protein
MPSREKPAIGDPFSQLTEKFSKSRTGWLATDWRSHRSLAEIPCKQGILQGKQPKYRIQD